MAIAQAELRFWHGKEANALPAAERALSIRPDLPEALCVKARYIEEQGDQEEANSLIDAALRGNPDSWEVNREAARMVFRQGRIAESIPYFEKAAALVNSDYYNPAMEIPPPLNTPASSLPAKAVHKGRDGNGYAFLATAPA